MADVVKMLVILVKIAAVWVSNPHSAATKMHIGIAHCTESAPIFQQLN